MSKRALTLAAASIGCFSIGAAGAVLTDNSETTAEVRSAPLFEPEPAPHQPNIPNPEIRIITDHSAEIDELITEYNLLCREYIGLQDDSELLTKGILKSVSLDEIAILKDAKSVLEREMSEIRSDIRETRDLIRDIGWAAD